MLIKQWASCVFGTARLLKTLMVWPTGHGKHAIVTTFGGLLKPDDVEIGVFAAHARVMTVPTYPTTQRSR